MNNAETNEPTNEKVLSWGAVAAGIGVWFIGALLCLSLEQEFSQDRFGLAVVSFSIAALFAFIGGYVAGEFGENAPVLNAAVMAGIPSALMGLVTLSDLLAAGPSSVWRLYLYLFGCCVAALLGGYAASKQRSTSGVGAALKERQLSLKAMTLGWLAAFLSPTFLYMIVVGVYLIIDLHDHPSGWAALDDSDYMDKFDIGTGAFTLASLALFALFESVYFLFAALGGYLAGRIGSENPVGNAKYVGAMLMGVSLLFLAASIPFDGFTGWTFLWTLTAAGYYWMAALGGRFALRRSTAQGV